MEIIELSVSLVLLAAVQARIVTGGISPVKGTDSPSNTAYQEIDQFLTTYGYYPSSGRPNVQVPNPSLRTYSNAERTQALKLFQKYFELSQSGTLDNETIRLLHSPRCGNPDITSTLNIKEKGAGLDREENEDVGETRNDDKNLRDREEAGANADRGRQSLDTSRRKRVKRMMQGLRNIGELRKWNRPLLKWSLFRPSRKLPVGVQRNIIQRAITYWQEVVPFKFVEMTKVAWAHMRIRFHSFHRASWRNSQHKWMAWRQIERTTENQQQTGYSHAHVRVPKVNGTTLSRDIHLDEGYGWSSTDELLSVLLHEIGHALGLDHSKDKNAVMYPYNRGVLEFSDSDIDGIKALYGSQNGKLRQVECTAKLNKVDHVFEAPWDDWYYVISGTEIRSVSPMSKEKDFWKHYTEVFPGAPLTFDVVFTDVKNKSNFFIQGNRLSYFKNDILVLSKNLSKEYLPETPLLAFNVHVGEEIARTILVGTKYWWIFKFDGENVVKTSHYENTDWILKLLPDVKFAVQWYEQTKIYVVKRDGSWVYLDLMDAKNFPSISIRGKPLWMEYLLCEREYCRRANVADPSVCYLSHGRSLNRWGMSRPSLVWVITLSLVKLF